MRKPDALERHNPLGLIKGDLRTRKFGGRSYSLSIIAPNKRVAKTRADDLRGHGVLVRLVKVDGGWGLYTR